MARIKAAGQFKNHEASRWIEHEPSAPSRAAATARAAKHQLPSAQRTTSGALPSAARQRGAGADPKGRGGAGPKGPNGRGLFGDAGAPPACRAEWGSRREKARLRGGSSASSDEPAPPEEAPPLLRRSRPQLRAQPPPRLQPRPCHALCAFGRSAPPLLFRRRPGGRAPFGPSSGERRPSGGLSFPASPKAHPRARRGARVGECARAPPAQSPLPARACRRARRRTLRRARRRTLRRTRRRKKARPGSEGGPSSKKGPPKGASGPVGLVCC